MKLSPPPPNESPAIALGDIYYILFRHKWKIAICSILGLAVGAIVYKKSPPPFHSEAKLYIRYVVADGKKPGPQREDVSTKSPDQGGETIMDSEQEILTSMDLARQVAETIGPEKILGTAEGENLVTKAATVINKGLLVEVPPRSSVIRVTFTHSDKAIVQPVLRELIDRYLKMHLEIHRAVGMVGDFLTQETEQLKQRLAATEEELRNTQSKAGVVSVEQAKKAAADQEARIREEIFNAQTELAERTTILDDFTKRMATTTGSSDALIDTSKLPLDDYHSINSRLASLRKKEDDLLNQFTDESSRVKQVRAQITEAESAKKKLESAFPQLKVYGSVGNGAAKSGEATFDPAVETARLNALQSKIKVLNEQLDSIRKDAVNLDRIDATLSELRRKKELEEANYRYYSASLEQSRIDEALGNGRVSNISEIQTPSAPVRDHRKTSKLAAAIAAAGIGLGLGWAFLIELYLDHSVRRPIDVERMLGLHLFLSIPALADRATKRLVGGDSMKALQAPKDDAKGPSHDGQLTASGRQTIRSIVPADILRPFHETLRDRLISYFESINLTHKPKLIAVTGLGRGSGVTTTAAGLASSLSETGEGNVLLVDMTVSQGSAQQFYKGKPVCDLDQMLDTRNTAQVQTNLYVVADGLGSDKFSRALPQRFSALASKLKASDFDYIIFDMPPVSQISITPRLAGFMDMVLLVLESEKTPREIVQRATALLSSSKAHVGAVLNKTKTYVPKKLHEEYLGSL
ncbi:MAG TPA: prefoldin subunit [Opitutaceae bacterium]|nr:prefoldin subunit [Opitutaceae bacterium]